MPVIKLGQEITLRTVQSIEDVDGSRILANPVTLAVVVTAPAGGTGDTFAIGDLAAVSTGVYEKDFEPDAAGLWRVSFTGAGNGVESYEEQEFEVEATLDASAGFRTLTSLIQDVRDELGSLNSTNYTDGQIERYLNDGQSRIAVYRRDYKVVAWPADAQSIELPTDCRVVGHLRPLGGTYVPDYEVQGSTLFFRDPPPSDGSARLDYESRFPRVASTQPCALPEPGPSGIVAYAAYRVLKRIAAYRADFKLYATQAQTNDVSSEDIERLADLHLREFEDVRDQLEQDVDIAVGH